VKNKKRIFITLGSIALVVALFVGSYIIRQNQQLEVLPVSALGNSEDIIETDEPMAEYGTMVGNEVSGGEELEGIVDETIIEDGSGTYGEPAPKLDEIYEDAMANSDLAPFEKELIRLSVQLEGKTFEEALQSVRPGSKVVEEQVPSNNNGNSSNTNNTQKPTTPTKPSNNNNNGNQQKPPANDSGSADYNNPDTRTDQEKYDDNNDPFSSGVEGNSDKIDWEPDF
jgi:hypothetical protein